jgi:hypothetical protein
MEQTLVDEGATATLTPDLQNRVSIHARRGMDYIDEQTDDVDVERQYDELYVTAEFEHGDISEFIDHLIVTPGRKFMSAIAFQAGIQFDADHVFYLYIVNNQFYGRLYPDVPRPMVELVDFQEVF